MPVDRHAVERELPAESCAIASIACGVCGTAVNVPMLATPVDGAL